MLEKQSYKNSKTPTKQILVFIVMVVVAFIYILVQYLIPQYDYERKLKKASKELIARSSTHKLLVENYMNCRTKSFRNSSRAQCIRQIHELSVSENLQDEFEQVSLDIKKELWMIKRND